MSKIFWLSILVLVVKIIFFGYLWWNSVYSRRAKAYMKLAKVRYNQHVARIEDYAEKEKQALDKERIELEVRKLQHERETAETMKGLIEKRVAVEQELADTINQIKDPKVKAQIERDVAWILEPLTGRGGK